MTWDEVVADMDRYLDYRFSQPDTDLELEIDKLISDYEKGCSCPQLFDLLEKLLWESERKYVCPWCQSNMTSGATDLHPNLPLGPDNPEVFYMFCCHCYIEYPFCGERSELYKDRLEADISWYKLCKDREKLREWIMKVNKYHYDKGDYNHE